MAGILNLSAIIPPSVVKLQVGVGNADYTDDQLRDSGFYDELVLDLYTWFPRYAELLNSGSAEENVAMQQLALKSYGKFFLCRRMAMSGRLAFWQNTKDGENDDKRFNLDWSKVIAEWDDEIVKARMLTLGIDTEFTPQEPREEVSGANLLGISRPSVDVVRR